MLCEVFSGFFHLLIFVEFTMSSEGLPEIDMSYFSGKSWTALSELMRAMILRTVDDLRSGGELREDALTYLYDEEEEYVFSFISICRHFGMDPEKTRDAIVYPKRRIRTRRRAA